MYFQKGNNTIGQTKSFSSENFEDLRQASCILLEGWEEHEHKSLVSLEKKSCSDSLVRLYPSLLVA